MSVEVVKHKRHPKIQKKLSRVQWHSGCYTSRQASGTRVQISPGRSTFLDFNVVLRMFWKKEREIEKYLERTRI